MSANNGRLMHVPRDEEVYTSLYLTTILTTQQLGESLFPSSHSAKKRMNKLLKHEYVRKESVKLDKKTPAVSLWYLSPRMFKREAKAAGRYEESFPEFPKKMAHYLKTNDLYTATYRKLRRIFGGPPGEAGWQWNNEARSHHSFDYAGESNVLMPDAEVVFPDGRVFFIERQTSVSKETARVFYEKAVRYRRYIDYRGLKKGQARVIFACDLKRDMDHALTACRETKMDSMVTDPQDAASYLIERARGK